MGSSREYELLRKILVIAVFIFVIGFWLLYYSIRITICATTNYCESLGPITSPIDQLDGLVVFFGVAMMLLSLMIYYSTGGEK